MGETAPTGNPEVDKRRSSRVAQAVPLLVTGVDALGRPFRENTSTLSINCQGCRYTSKHYLLRNMQVTLEVPPREANGEPRSMRARVAWTQRPHTVRELFQVSVELETGGNIWGLDSPPADWFPFREDQQGGSEILPPSPSEVLSIRPEENWAAAGLEPVEDNVRTMPLANAPEARTALEEEMARLMSEAKRELRAAAREYASEAASEEARALVAALQLHLRTAADHYVTAAAGPAVETALRQANEAAREAWREQWNRQRNESIEQATDAAMERMGTAAREIERDLDSLCRAAAERWIAAIAKAADTTQTTFETLFKTSEWYEKRFHSRMQEILEKGIERAAGSMREKAGEFAGLFAAELGHFSHSHLEHTQEEFEALEKRAENRLNEICRQVFADAGKELLQRLSDLGASPAAAPAATPSNGPRARPHSSDQASGS